MWQLIAAIVLLVFSLVINASNAIASLSIPWQPGLSASQKEEILRYYGRRHEVFLRTLGLITFAVGVTMLFLAVGSKWGLASIGIYLAVLMFVFIPIVRITRYKLICRSLRKRDKSNIHRSH